eukprot:CAMPEP_0181492988 /NCGR_PEP_ID=MMETSP1110-20121109/50981_1 /TAXON_ID=174948 /ORGANISM="Symbiodinium sp., Strain CCMP421" /LENGTH=169 /DNA_ID=CAMNT_0023620269 /DNA_START=70 /DNA_END=579 /DNA_ORIENTATION=-
MAMVSSLEELEGDAASDGCEFCSSAPQASAGSSSELVSTSEASSASETSEWGIGALVLESLAACFLASLDFLRRLPRLLGGALTTSSSLNCASSSSRSRVSCSQVGCTGRTTSSLKIMDTDPEEPEVLVAVDRKSVKVDSNKSACWPSCATYLACCEPQVAPIALQTAS